MLNPLKTFEKDYQLDIRNQILFENIRRLKVIGVLGSFINVVIIGINYRLMGTEGLITMDSILRLFWIAASVGYILGVGRPTSYAGLTNKHRTLFFGAAGLSLFFASLITSILSVDNGYTFLYIINCMLTASFLYLSFVQILLVLMPSILWFVFVLMTVQDTALNLVGNVVNIFAVSAFAILIAGLSYQDRVTIIDSQQMIKRHNKALQDLAELDGLTLLLNRRKFDQVLAIEWAHAQRSQMPLSLLMIDVDSFKNFNDTYGHLAGDDCLKQIAQLLKETLRRETDCVSRYGGEEFVVLLPDTNEKGGHIFAEHLREKIYDQKIPHENTEFGVVTISIGVATLNNKNIDSKEALINAADKAMYESKRSGRNRVS